MLTRVSDRLTNHPGAKKQIFDVHRTPRNFISELFSNAAKLLNIFAGMGPRKGDFILFCSLSQFRSSYYQVYNSPYSISIEFLDLTVFKGQRFKEHHFLDTRTFTNTFQHYK